MATDETRMGKAGIIRKARNEEDRKGKRVKHGYEPMNTEGNKEEDRNQKGRSRRRGWRMRNKAAPRRRRNTVAGSGAVVMIRNWSAKISEPGCWLAVMGV